ncbi:SDR family oxidoreductase [Planctomycetota bacterium]
MFAIPIRLTGSLKRSSLNNDRPLTNVAPYAMSKAAMGQMTKALALEWGDQGVRENVV